VREQSEAVNPPRALWVPFPLGRPLGAADDPDFQKDVMRSALAMLDTASEPTIQDYPIEAPPVAGPGVWACPLNLPVAEATSHTGRLLAEVARLKPWSLETRNQRGRTLFGATGAQPDQVEAVAAALGSIADTGDLQSTPGDIEWAFEMPILIRHLADDLRTFYHEAVAAQPGSTAPNHEALSDWIFGETALGDVLQTINGHLTAADDFIMTLVSGFLIPEAHHGNDDGGHWSSSTH